MTHKLKNTNLYQNSFKEKLKRIKLKWFIIRNIKLQYKKIKTQDWFEKVVKIENHVFISIRKYMIGHDNKIIIGYNTHLDKSYIRIVGNNNYLILGIIAILDHKAVFGWKAIT